MNYFRTISRRIALSADNVFGLSSLFFLCMLMFSCGETKETPSGVEIALSPGFTAEHLYSPTADSVGSWVSLTTDGEGRLLASDQYGFLYRITPPPIGETGETKVEKLAVEVGYAQGLLWAYNSLYVMVNASKDQGVEGRSSGFYRVTDNDGDGELDTVTLLQALDGSGEHGPHAVLLAPDGNSLYIVAGNHTLVPDNFTSRNPNNRSDDNLFPSIKDPGGHAQHVRAPAGWVAKTDSVGSSFEVIASGFRNSYDMGFNAADELLVFDSDMEWDMAMPWYRPIRVLHATSGAEFGWRTGSGKWPAYYPDNLPEVVNIGQGSPTGVIMGQEAKFPARYQNGMFIFDWSFGTMYFIELTEDGSSYTGVKEEFLSGVPLPLADGVIGADGAMYFVVGGRRLDSDLYRVYYSGAESTEPAIAASSSEAKELRDLRHQLEAMHTSIGIEAVKEAWWHLDHEDRHIRYAARIAIENQPFNQWAGYLWKSTQPEMIIPAAIATARAGNPGVQSRLLDLIAKRVDYAKLSEAQQINLLRAYSLIFSRMGNPTPGQAADLVSRLSPHFPAKTEVLNRELCQVLSYLQDPTVAAKTLALMAESGGKPDAPAEMLTASVSSRSERYGPAIERILANMPPSQEIMYARWLSYVKTGWTPELRKQYFLWFYDAINRDGGNSYKGFIESIRNQALKSMSDADREQLAEALGDNLLAGPKGIDFANLPQPVGPGKEWIVSEIAELTRDKNMVHRDFANGKKMFDAALCSACHSMQGQGGNTGPDLSQIGTRFSGRDLTRAMTNPSSAISDQYGATRLLLKDGSIVVGRIMDETDAVYKVNQNPFSLDKLREIPKNDVESKEESLISLMPAGLLNRLNETEVQDLMAYLMSNGDPKHEMFQ